jgi:hypothetical protein
MTSAMRVARRPGNGKQAISASQRSASAKKARPDHKTRKSCIAYSIRMTLPFAIISPPQFKPVSDFYMCAYFIFG